MGHYGSEMGDPSTAHDEPSLEGVVPLTLAERGYSQVRTSHHLSNVVSGRGDDEARLRHHHPCGQAVFEPDVHDKYCPAK